MTTKIGPDDARYDAVVQKQFNKRFIARPDYVQLVNSTEEVVAAVADAVTGRLRVVVTSGGHCLEGFVSDPAVRVIIDVSLMKRIYFDETLRAVCVEAGATVGETFKALYDNWSTVVPLGEYPQIGIGGHVAGGAFGFLCRQLGLAADYLYAVEVVRVDANSRVDVVLATREPDDPNRDLWWAHTGGGAGNFGIVTRYWFRSLDASGHDPAQLLPAAPSSITTFRTEFNWSELDQQSFVRLLRNYGTWCEQNSAPDSPNTSLFTLLVVPPKQLEKIVLRGVSTAGANAGQQIEDYLRQIQEGTARAENLEVSTMTWLEFALNPFPDLFAGPPGGVSTKVKDALLKQRFTDEQMQIAYEYLTAQGASGMLGLATYGGRVNTVAPDTTASALRSAIMDTACNTGWVDPNDEAKSLKWVRDFYQQLFAESGGVPVPGAAYDGALINHPDTDLRDSSLNTSGVPWSTIYYQDNYPRLQQIKARWDPLNIFHHALSIQVGE
jgi:hypothetical protein